MSERHAREGDTKQVATGTTTPLPVQQYTGSDAPVDNTNPLPVIMTDANGVPLTSHTTTYGTNALDIHVADVHHTLIDQFVHVHTTTVTTLAVAVTGGLTNSITVADSTGFVAGDFVHINTTAVEKTHPKIISVVGNVIQLDRYLDFDHPIGDTVTLARLNMATTVGTLAAPIVYGAEPENGEIWHVTRLLFEMTHSVAGDLGKFGGIAALANGVVIRVFTGGVYTTLTNWKDNSHIKTDMYDVAFDTRSGGGGTYGTTGRWTLGRAGVVARLDAATSDRIEVYIQDDISALLSFTLKVQGHFGE